MSFSLYSTDGCHLCEQAFDMLIREIGLAPDSLSVIDIALDDGLIEQFGVHIPVLERAGTDDRLYWPFSAIEASHFIQANDSR
jgi:hypothetical protein